MRPLLFSVPARGFCLQVQSRSRGVKESRSREVETNRRHRLSGRSWARLRAIPGLPDSSVSRPRNLASGPGGTAPKKTQNNTNEASMLLKTQGSFEKRTQNELKTNPKRTQFRVFKAGTNAEFRSCEARREETPHLARYSRHPPRFLGFRWSDPNRTRNRTPQGRGLLTLLEEGSDADGLLLLNRQLSTSRLDSGGTKRECL
jgi:hypothetical protein